MKSAWILSVILLSQAALAATFDNEEVVVIKKPAVIEDSSEFHRMGKDWQLTAQLFGVAVAPVDTTGVSVGRFIDRNKIIIFDFMKNAGNGKWFWSSEYEVKTQSIGHTLNIIRAIPFITAWDLITTAPSTSILTEALILLIGTLTALLTGSL